MREGNRLATVFHNRVKFGVKIRVTYGGTFSYVSFFRIGTIFSSWIVYFGVSSTIMGMVFFVALPIVMPYVPCAKTDKTKLALARVYAQYVL